MLFVIFIGVGLAMGFVSQIYHNPFVDTVLGLLALFVTLLAFLTKDYMYLMISLVQNRNKRTGNKIVVNSAEAFLLSSSGSSIIRREGDSVYASSFVKVPLYRSATEMTSDEKLEFSKLFGKIFTLSKTPIKLTSQLYVINNDEYIGKLRNMLNQAEDKYRNMQAGNEDRHSAAFERSQGEVSMWRNLLESVSRAHSQSLMLYAMVSSWGGNDEEASNIAYQRAEELAVGISTILGVSASVMTGNELLALIEPEYMIPTETVSERIRQKTIGGL
jgi:hypothetical protein